MELTDLRWSPDGRSILSRRWNGGTLHLIDVQTGDATPIVQFDPNDTVSFGSPAWSPDGKAIIYGKSIENSQRIVMRDLGTGKEKELCEFYLKGSGRGSGVAVSPDGRQLAFAEMGKSTEDYAGSLKLMPIEGGEPREIPGSQGMVNHGFVRPAWTPDGRYILSRKGSGEPPGLLAELWLIPAEGGEPQKLLEMGTFTRECSSVSVHPDGQRIAFTRGGSDEGLTWAIDNFLPGFTADK